MFMVPTFYLWFLSSDILAYTIPIAKPGCPTRCGNVTIYYPFGIGLDGACSFNEFHKVYCNTSHDPPKPFLNDTNLDIRDMSISGQIRTSNAVAAVYFHGGEVSPTSSWINHSWIYLNELPVVFSDTDNKLTLIGCDDYVYIYGELRRTYRSGCDAGCSEPEDVINGSCSGIGCCQTSIPKGVRRMDIHLHSFYNHINVSNFNPYSFAFLAEQDKFSFSVTDLNDRNLVNRIRQNVPVVLEWFVGGNQTCREAKRNSATYACQKNTNCTDFDDGLGYRCSCLPGYQGNPYLSPGCTDINECSNTTSNLCSAICTNIPGSYICSCPKRQHGDGFKNGTGCTGSTYHSQFVIRLSLGLILGFLSLLSSVSWICFTMIRRNHHMKMRVKFFEQNGGVLLKQQLSQKGRTMESSNIFSANELKVATNNYSEDRIIGKGGNGIVYMGILKNGCEVAIKKSKVVDQTQVEHFINEVVILTQINHRNVVKLLGCCLETEVPLLVYQFISNGTLFEHIHKNKGITSWLTWTNCVRLASEAAAALMYLHSAASIPIIHRDVKSTNILLDEIYTAKISDFGASRLVPIDQEQVTTLVQGTMGYLDPEYLHNSHLTEKSDVYSFGVVLAELLTREKPLSSLRRIEERNLSTYFVLAMKEDRLMEILDPQLVREASEEQLLKMAKLVKECLNVKGEDRPTMKEVTLELEGLKKQNRHPWDDQNEDTTNFMGQQDLYPLYPSIGKNGSASNMELSGQYSMEMNLISDMNNPR